MQLCPTRRLLHRHRTAATKSAFNKEGALPLVRYVRQQLLRTFVHDDRDAPSVGIPIYFGFNPPTGGSSCLRGVGPH